MRCGFFFGIEVSLPINNVRQVARYHVVMSSDTHIILIEREETGPATTVYFSLDPNAILAISRQFSTFHL